MDSPVIQEVVELRAYLKEAKDVLDKILYTDERGQGIGYAESMRHAAQFLKKLEERYGT